MEIFAALLIVLFVIGIGPLIVYLILSARIGSLEDKIRRMERERVPKDSLPNRPSKFPQTESTLSGTEKPSKPSAKTMTHSHGDQQDTVSTVQGPFAPATRSKDPAPATRPTESVTPKPPATQVTKPPASPTPPKPPLLAASKQGQRVDTSQHDEAPPVTSQAAAGEETDKPGLVDKLNHLDLEHWLGIRGAAVLGGIVLAFAGLYLFKYAIDKGFITPVVRIGLAIALGISAQFFASRLRRKSYENAANGLAGGGFVVLYAAAWAANTLYSLTGSVITLITMVFITAACTSIAVRHRTMAVAILGLVGGFATPFLLNTQLSSPFGLLLYIACFNSAILWIAKRQNWSILPLLSIIGSAIHIGFIFASLLTNDNAQWIMVSLLFLPLLYTFLCRQDKPIGQLGYGLSFVITLLFALGLLADMAETIDPWVLGPFLMVLIAGSCRLGADLQKVSMSPSLALASQGAIFAYGLQTSHDGWIIVTLNMGIWAVPFAFARWARDQTAQARYWQTTFIAMGSGAIPWVALLILDTPAHHQTWMNAALFTATVCLWIARRPAYRSLLQWTPMALTAFFLAMGINNVWDSHIDPQVTSTGERDTWLLIALSAVGHWAMRYLNTKDRGFLSLGLYTMGLAPLLLLAGFRTNIIASPLTCLLLGTILALSPLILALRLPHAAYFAAAGLGMWLLQLDPATYLGEDFVYLPHSMATLMLTAAAVCYAPFLVGRDKHNLSQLSLIAALAPLAWTLPLLPLYRLGFGDDGIALVPITMALLTALAGQQIFKQRPLLANTAPRLLCYAGVSLTLITLALPLELDHQWLTVAIAIEPILLLWVWQRFPHRYLRYIAWFLNLVVWLRLAVNPAIFGGDYQDLGGRFINWMLWTYGSAVISIVIQWRMLRSGVREPIHPLCTKPQTQVSANIYGALFMSAITVAFVWINLAISQAFLPHNHPHFFNDRLPAADLTRSIAWILFALGLLTAGWRIGLSKLRRLGLGFLVLAISKVFIYDLAHLTDLYRAAALLGLAISLFAVSVGYQHFSRNFDPEDSSNDE